MQTQKHLLPIGFYDLLGDEAKTNQETIDILLNSFYAKKYQLIKTPLVEFEESLAGNLQIADQSFKMTDSLSGKTLVLRNDITPQIARLMATKLQNITMPIRLCYVGDVLKIKNDNLYADRQLTQVGIELIGQDSDSDSCSSNLEIIELTLSSLKKIKLPNLTLNFCCPQFLNILLEQLNIGEDADLKTAIASKNIFAIKNLSRNLPKEYSEDLINLALENNDFTKINLVIDGLPIDKQTRDQLEKWQKTIDSVKQNHPEISFSVDIFGDDEFSYHNQIGFTVFAGASSVGAFPYPVARGGRYFVNESTLAVGATIYINNLRKILTT